jgi:hypothetical protein
MLSLLLCLVLLLCAGVPACGAGSISPIQACPRPDTRSAPPDSDVLTTLAGRYEITFVNVDGEYGDSVASGTLMLWPNDSARRYAYVTPQIGRQRGERPLAGSFDSRSSTVPSYPNSYEPATPERPAVELIESTLYFGGIDATDGAGQRLQITRVGSSGFTGLWRYSGGIEVTIDTATGRIVREPSGYFCARRLHDR